MITKTEAMANLTIAETAEYAMCEQTIDAALSTFDGTRKCISIEPSTRVRDRLIDAYRRAGWAVKYDSCQREGGWFEFT